MRKRILTAAFVVALTAMTAWAGDKTVELNVKGMSCEACPPAVSSAVKGVKGVKACNVDLKSGKASVTADESVKNEDLVKAVTDAGHGFTAEVVQ
jgi:periplasmic mercuric ion binding protein